MISRRFRFSLAALLAAVAALSCGVFPAVSAAPSAPATSRIVGSIDERQRAPLPGNMHPAAIAMFDKGAVDPGFEMRGMRLILNRSPERAAALSALMAQQLDPHSVNYHRWLTPEQFGAQFGPSDADIGALTNWLQSQGFVVDDVNKGRTFLQFSGTASRVASAFRAPIHRYVIDGKTHVANSGDPSIPAALRPVVVGITSLNNFFAIPLHHDLGTVTRSTATGNWRRDATAQGPGAQFAPPGSSFQLMAPNDFAMIYNVQPLWNAGLDGTGQSIAIAGRSAIKLSDVAAFRAAFGLPANAPTVIVNGPDPGVPNLNEQLENTLDVEWSGAVAKGANIVFVTTASTNTADGATASAEYIIEHQLASIMSFSYGLCERALGSAGNAQFNALWQQAAAQGISVFVASGDQGAAGCDAGGPPLYGAQKGLAVNGTASTPYDIAVGGTDLNWVNRPGTSYWANTSLSVASALQYVPEVPWNSSCASLAYNQWVGATANGLDPEQYCNTLLAQRTNLRAVSIIGGGGGVSSCTSPSGGFNPTCGGGYAKPAWQSGAGVPADGRRDVPDVSLFAANGALQTAYVVCVSALAPCNYAVANNALAQAVGGTSVSSPAMAGIMALVNQKRGVPQGNANAAFYGLAARDNRANCNSATVAAGNACNFYDIAGDSNALPCVANSPNCVVAHAGDKLGILSGHTATPGYDLATGLGTVNAYNLVNNWQLSSTPLSTVGVPNVVGSTQAAATALLTNAGLVLGTITSQSSTTVAAGVVISESPMAGSSVSLGSGVNLLLSSGAPVVVPNEVGATQAAATLALQSAGFVLGTVIQQVNACAMTGTVLSQTPVAGTLAARGSSINLVIAAAAPKTRVPNTRGLTQAAASSALRAVGLVLGTVTQQSSRSVAKGYVISQNPPAGIQIAACSKVDLVISSGASP